MRQNAASTSEARMIGIPSYIWFSVLGVLDQDERPGTNEFRQRDRPSKYRIGQLLEHYCRRLLDIRVKRIPMRIHRHNRRKVLYLQMPHRFRYSKFEEAHVEHSF